MVLLLSVVCVSCVSTSHSQSAVNATSEPETRKDSVAITQAALDFEEGWYEGDSDRIARVLHPDFIMRHVGTVSETGKSIVDQNVTAPELIRLTQAGVGKVLPDRRQHDITVLDVFQNAATAKIVAWYGVDYLQLAKWNGQWLIISVLWGRNPRPNMALPGK